MLMTKRQIDTTIAAVEIDGVARRMVLCTPDVADAHVKAIMHDAEIDAVVVEEDFSSYETPGRLRVVTSPDRLQPVSREVERNIETEWVLLTSGTTGPPKLAVHSLASLVAPLEGSPAQEDTIWSTFYDIRRYGGLQILLRALVGGGSVLLSGAGEPIDRFLARAGAAGVTHISGTPSHWRGVLMSAAANNISPAYLRLSGEACDQAILDRLKLAYPQSKIAHAFASTEAGVAFDVKDGLAGFPASLICRHSAGVQMQIEGGSLRIRSGRMASRYLGAAHAGRLLDHHGFVDTGDLLDLRGDRYYFIGRRGGVINVGGLKVHPEAVEAVINEHPAVHTSRVSGRPSPITGALVVAEVVMKQPYLGGTAAFSTIREELLELCQNRLPRYQIPMTFRRTRSLEVAASGKMARPHA